MHFFDWSNLTWGHFKYLVVILAFVPFAYLIKALFDFVEKLEKKKEKSIITNKDDTKNN